MNPLIYSDVKPVIFVSIEHLSASKFFEHFMSILNSRISSGDLDCSDSSDEENCDDKPLSILKDFTCMHGYRCAQQRHEQYDYAPLCIPLHELCDGLKQCPLGDDEHQARCRM